MKIKNCLVFFAKVAATIVFNVIWVCAVVKILVEKDIVPIESGMLLAAIGCMIIAAVCMTEYVTHKKPRHATMKKF